MTFSISICLTTFAVVSLVLLAACAPADEPARPETPPDSDATSRVDEEEPAASAEPEAETSEAEPPEAAPDEREPEPEVAETPPPPGPNPALMDPNLAHAQAPDQFKVRFSTTKGDFVLDVTRSWAPRGVDRLYNLLSIGYFEDIAFFRVIDGFMAQFGISGDPEITKAWGNARITDDPVKESNLRGYLSFATSGPDSRTTQMFINYQDNARLDSMGFSPVGKVVEGMEVIDSLYSEYGEGGPRGKGPHQGLLRAQGNNYLQQQFPELDYIKNTTIEE